ncbi:hypothetical protein OROHE_013460 [Orobanche hederae]
MFGRGFFTRLVGLELLFNLGVGSPPMVAGGGRYAAAKIGVFRRVFDGVGGGFSGSVGAWGLRAFVSLELRRLLQVVLRVAVAGGRRSTNLKFRSEFPAAGGDDDFSGDVFFDELYVVSLGITLRSQW